jgi:hypothetical protein
MSHLIRQERRAVRGDITIMLAWYMAEPLPTHERILKKMARLILGALCV